MENSLISKGIVEFIEFPANASIALRGVLRESDAMVESLIRELAIKRMEIGNLVFNFPREQYSKLDRGETPEVIAPGWLTLSNDAYSNPAIQTVTGETMRLPFTTRAVDPINPKNTLFRFILDAGQFVGAFSTAILIGGSDATSTVGTGKIIAAVNNVKDDTNAPLNRDGTTIHLVNWKLKHLDSSEV